MNLSSLNILVFKVSGVRMGIDTEQIAEILDAETAEKSGMNMKRLNEVVCFGKRNINFIRPKAIRPKVAGMPLIVIEDPETILDIDMEDVRPMPVIAEKLGSRAVWGAALADGGIILLVDFCRLEKAC